MRRIANGEVSSQNVTHKTNVSAVQRALTDITNATPTSVLDEAQRNSIRNRNDYQRRKERNPMRTSMQTLQDDPYNFVYDGVPKKHRVLKVQKACVRCGAKRLQFEFPTFCCMDGKTKLAHSSIPDELLDLFTSRNELGNTFRQRIRAYNSNFSFASMGVDVAKTMTDMTYGVYTFCVNGGMYHRIDQLIPRDGIPRDIQLYFYDADYEMSNRLQWKNIDKRIAEKLIRILATNPYVQIFRRLGDLGPLDNYRVTLNASVELDQRVYNRPTTSEVAGIWVEGNDNIAAYKRSIIVYARSDKPKTIQSYRGCYDPLSYPLFFPYDESGWHSNIPRHGIPINNIINDDDDIGDDLEDSNTKKERDTVSMREYYCYKFQIRSNYNVILMGGRLLQQFVVDIYIKLETSRLDFCRKNQSKIRADLYQGVVDCVNAGEVRSNMIGQRVVLPASFIGGPRDMRRRFLDAMTLVQDDGKPGIFLTMTCNPNWPEIKNELLPWQTSQDRPDLVSRVFHAKLEDLKKQLFTNHVLGVVGSYVYVIEFQKRGLSHAHFLLIMKPPYKLTNADHYDKIVCAEIPDPKKYPEMHELVVSHMIHGPCGGLNSDCPCMNNEQKKCRFRYPRQFNETTLQGKDSYPVYRRRDNGIEVDVRGNKMDNRWVVPYNPKLLMMFNCHLNVEVCSSITSVKYVFKYIYKGHDKQVINIDPDGQPVAVNEIKWFQDARYVSPLEAMWRIFSFPLSQIHPFVMALQVHLPNQQMVRFSEDDTLTSVVEKEKDRRSMLTAFFLKNKEDTSAREIKYRDFPKKFTWDPSSRRWHHRKQGLMRGRMVSANPDEGERYYLRLLLLHISGPTCFEDLYTVNNVQHPTFRKATLERGLIESDDGLSQYLTEASLFQAPIALRRMFATILTFCEPGDVRKIWDDHYNDLSEDYRRQYGSIERVQNMVLTDIKIFLQSMSDNIDCFDLPKINENVDLEFGVFREVQEECSIVLESEHLQARDFLNPEQKFAYDEIMRHVHSNIPGVFFIDGPGGTGKTFLYKALLANIRSCGHIALATASSGVAANNMPWGKNSSLSL
ncbi:unnamed protein product [Lactuca virosa]|uniref:ATP-dependent DNA helicase n=1 Tax=Lactuca virosa TaxID=75947 RepID=A0AAU9N175_9ASTR|nr:unnamed protein product [Lactuca virosa]